MNDVQCIEGVSASSRRVPAVRVSNAGKRFAAGPPILDDVTVDVAAGEFVSLLGPSGCGKSTLLRLVAGLTPPTAGTIEIDGMTPAKARETVSFIFQDATLLPWRTVRENVALGLELEHTARDVRSAKVSEMLALVGLQQAADAYPRELSGGMKMRTSIARALATSPRLLLLDEPFAALDEMTRDRMNEELLRLRGRHGWTVLFVTHSVTEAVFLSDRILILAAHPGRLVDDIRVERPALPAADARETEPFEWQVAMVSRKLRAAESRGTLAEAHS